MTCYWVCIFKNDQTVTLLTFITLSSLFIMFISPNNFNLMLSLNICFTEAQGKP